MPIRVELTELQTRKKQLNRYSRIAVGASIYDRDPKFLDYHLGLGAPVVGCIIPEEDGVLAPAR